MREVDRRSPTPAQALRRAGRPLTADEVLLRWLFPTLVSLPKPLNGRYWRDVETRQIPDGTRHGLERAA